MKFAVILGLVLFSLALGGAAGRAQAGPDSPPILVASGSGGSVVEFARRVSTARQVGQGVAFIGRCDSACTLFLSMPSSRVCIVPGASFTFHRPYGASEDFNAWAANYLLDSYPGWVRRWIISQGGLTDRSLRMDYVYASRFIPDCSSAGRGNVQS